MKWQIPKATQRHLLISIEYIVMKSPHCLNSVFMVSAVDERLAVFSIWVTIEAYA